MKKTQMLEGKILIFKSSY